MFIKFNYEVKGGFEILYGVPSLFQVSERVYVDYNGNFYYFVEGSYLHKNYRDLYDEIGDLRVDYDYLDKVTEFKSDYTRIVFGNEYGKYLISKIGNVSIYYYHGTLENIHVDYTSYGVNQKYVDIHVERNYSNQIVGFRKEDHR